MLPVMLSRGYHPTMATGPLMAIGAVDMLIPPSALTVLLGSLSGISISKLLIGGIVPGLILSVAFVVVHRVAGEDESVARAGARLHRVPRLGEIRALRPVRGAAGLDLRRRGRLDVGGLGDADRIGAFTILRGVPELSVWASGDACVNVSG